MKIRASGCSDRGLVRDSNEDVLLVDAELGLFAVLDGVGGEAAGELAARTAADALQLSLWYSRYRADLEPTPLVGDLPGAVRAANVAVVGEAASIDGVGGMGCTVTAVQIVGDRATVAHVGDSRLYLVRGCVVHRITHDHTVAAELVRQGLLHPSQARRHPGAHTLTESLGGRPEVHVESHQLDLRTGDRLLLCTDGLSDYVGRPEDLADLVSGSPIDTTAAALLAFALDSGGHDNITILVIEVSTVAGPLTRGGTSLHVAALS